MKKHFILLATIVLSCNAYSQVGINNTAPRATFDVTAATSDGSRPEGFIVPRLRGDEIKLADSMYTSLQTGVIVYATAAVSSPSVKTVSITAPGYYYFDGNIWQKIGGGAGSSYVGSTSVTLNGISFERAALSGDVTAPANSNSVTVSKIQNIPVSANVPSNGQMLRYNSAASQWESYTYVEPTMNVTSELTSNYTAQASDDIILFNNPVQVTLTLPMSGISTGKRLYVSSIGAGGIDYGPAGIIRNTTYNSLSAGTSATLIYIGAGKWEVVSGY